MKKLFSTGYSVSAFNLALFVLRVGSGLLMMNHGYDKLTKFNEIAPKFMQFLGMSSYVSLALVVFAEFFCAIFVVLGLFTRLACVVLVIETFVAVAKAHNYEIFDKGEHAALYVLIFFTILIVGPGRISVDGMINK